MIPDPYRYNRRVRVDSPHYVYRCYDYAGRLIYVGCSVNPVQRVKQHRYTSWWGTQILDVRLIVFPSKDYALQKEREAIGEERPRWNVTGKWNHRSLWAAEDYVDYYTAVNRSGNSAGFYNSAHLERVAREAKQRYGLVLGEAVA
jgi:excinuclease UvrABC nuclease subunit